jgi:hypothetical protein
MKKKILFLVSLFIMITVFAVKANNYNGWDSSFNKSDRPSSDLDITILEDTYKRDMLSLLQKDREIETELTIIELKLVQMEMPVFTMYEKTFNSLAQYMDLVRKVYEPAVISGNFYDWRDVSKYRRAAGLHYGYDIAMPAGTAVVSGWTGDVVDIVQWYGQEYGVTVKSAGNIYVTYGHITPLVSVGQKISTGTLLGLVVADHVDIKMRDENHNYIDFASTKSSELVIKKLDNSSVINPLKSDKYKLKARGSINREMAYIEYLKKSNIFYNLKLKKITEPLFSSAEDYYRKEELFLKGCIARNDVTKAGERFFKTSYNRYSSLKERIAFKLKNVPGNVNMIAKENGSARNNILKARSYAIGLKEKKILTKMMRDNEYIKLFILNLNSGTKSGIIKTSAGFPPFSLGSKESNLSMAEKRLKDAEQSLQDSRQNYEKSQNLYSLGYISRKDLDQSGDNYQRALANYREINQLLMR